MIFDFPNVKESIIDLLKTIWNWYFVFMEDMKMKRLLCIVLAVIMIMSMCVLASCSGGAGSSTGSSAGESSDAVSDEAAQSDESDDAVSDSRIFTYSFADKAEAADLLLSNRNYYDNLNQLDLDFRVQKKGATLPELEKIAREQTLDITDEEKALIDEAMAEIEKTCSDRGYNIPAIDGIVFAKTTMKEECDASAYTHGTQIYLGERVFDLAKSDDKDEQELFQVILAHELFHCLTRNHPDFRESMYGVLGFTVVGKDYEFKKNVRDQIISNPDVEHHNSYATFTIDGEDKACVVIFTTTTRFEKPGDIFFDGMVTGLVPIDDLGTMYTADDASNFWEVFGENTNYVIDPEETLADNFSFLIHYGKDGMEYKTPEIIEKMEALLLK